MALTPVDILHTQFKTSLRGYNRQQVDEFVRSVRESLEEALRERIELERRTEMLQEEVDRIRKIESAMTDALTLAQKSADEFRTNAHRHAEMIVQEAEQSRVRMVVEAQREADRLRAEIALLESARDRFEAEFRGMLSSHLEWLEKRKPAETEAQAEVA